MENINQIIEEIIQVNNKIITQENLYTKNKREETYSPNYEYTDFDQEIINGENVIDCILENIQRNKIILKLYSELIIKLNTIRNKIIENMKEEMKERENNENKLKQTIEQLKKINIIEKEKEIKNDKQEIQNIQKEKEQFENEFKKYKINLYYEKYNLKKEEKIQLENWTNKKIGEIIFDSEKDDWKVNTSVFQEKIINKQKFIVLIEDTNGNKFGGYLNVKVDKFYPSCISDSSSFVFSFKSNQMKKFDISPSQSAFYLYPKTNNGNLFGFGNGHDLSVWVENRKSESYCYQSSYNYSREQKALCGTNYPDRFTPKRFIVIQMK